MGGYSKVLPLSAGPTTRNDVVKGPQSVMPSEQLVTQIVPLDYVKAGYVVDPVKVGAPGLNIVPLANGSSVLLTGKAVLLNRAANIIRALDAPDSIRTIKAISLNHTSAKLAEWRVVAVLHQQPRRLVLPEKLVGGAGTMVRAQDRVGRLRDGAGRQDPSSVDVGHEP